MSANRLTTLTAVIAIIAMLCLLAFGVPYWAESNPEAVKNPNFLVSLILAMSNLVRRFGLLLAGVVLFFIYMFFFLLFLTRVRRGDTRD